MLMLIQPCKLLSSHRQVIVNIYAIMVFLFGCYSSYQACELFIMLALISDNLISDTLTKHKSLGCVESLKKNMAAQTAPRLGI